MAEARTKAIQEAYVTLSDEDRRTAYERLLPPIDDLSPAFEDPVMNVGWVWKKMAAWMRDEDIGSSFLRKIAYRTGDLIDRGRAISGRISVPTALELGQPPPLPASTPRAMSSLQRYKAAPSLHQAAAEALLGAGAPNPWNCSDSNETHDQRITKNDVAAALTEHPGIFHARQDGLYELQPESESILVRRRVHRPVKNPGASATLSPRPGHAPTPPSEPFLRRPRISRAHIRPCCAAPRSTTRGRKLALSAAAPRGGGGGSSS